jgi:hypothetical protein
MTLAEQLAANATKLRAPRKISAAPPMTLAEQLAAQSTKLRPMTNTIKPIDDN